MATSTLRPSADYGTPVSVEALGAASSPWADDIDEGVGSQDGNGVQGVYNATPCSYECDLTASDSDFSTAEEVRIYTYVVFGGSQSNDSLLLEVDLVNSSDVSLIGGWQTVYNWTTGSPSNQLFTNQILSPTAFNKTVADDARLKYRWTKTKSGGWDTMVMGVDLADVQVDYTPSADADVTPAALTVGATFSQAARSGSAARTPAALAVGVTMPQAEPSTATNAVVEPAAATFTVAPQQAARSGSAARAPPALGPTVTFPQATPDGGAADFVTVETADTQTSEDTGSGDHTVTLPTNLSDGDGILIIITIEAGTVTSGPSGYTRLDSATVSYTIEHSAWYKVASSEGSSVTFSVSADVETTHIAYRCSGIGDWSTTPPELSEGSYQGTNFDTPSLSPSFGSGKTTWLSTWGVNNTVTTVSAVPSNYGSMETIDHSGAVGPMTGSAHRAYETGTEDPGAWTTTYGSGRVQTIAIPQGGAAGGVDATATPAALAVGVTCNQAARSGGAARSPAAAALTVAHPQSGRSVGVIPSPAALAATLTANQATRSGEASRTPAVLGVTVTFPQTGRAAGTARAPAALAVTVTCPQATPTTAAGTIVQPAALAVGVTMPQAGRAADTARAPPALTVEVTHPQAGRAVTVSTAPTAAALTVTFPQAGRAVTASPAPAVLGVTVTTPQTGRSGTALRTLTATVITVTPAQALPQVGGDATVQPAALTVGVTFPQTGRAVDTTSSPAALAVTVTCPQAVPTSAADTIVTPAPLAVTVTCQQTGRAGGTLRSPAVLEVPVGHPQTARSVTVTVTPAAFEAVTGTPQTSRAADATRTLTATLITVTFPQTVPQAGGNIVIELDASQMGVTFPQATVVVVREGKYPVLDGSHLARRWGR